MFLGPSPATPANLCWQVADPSTSRPEALLLDVSELPEHRNHPGAPAPALPGRSPDTAHSPTTAGGAQPPPHPVLTPARLAVLQVDGGRHLRPLGRHQPLLWASRRAAERRSPRPPGGAARGSRLSEPLRQRLPRAESAARAAATHPAASCGSQARPPGWLPATAAPSRAFRDLCVRFRGLCVAKGPENRDFHLPY